MAGRFIDIRVYPYAHSVYINTVVPLFSRLRESLCRGYRSRKDANEDAKDAVSTMNACDSPSHKRTPL